MTVTRSEREQPGLHAGHRSPIGPGRLDQLHGDAHGHPGRPRRRPLPQHLLCRRHGGSRRRPRCDVLAATLTIDKSNDAPLETLELPDGTTATLPTAKEGSTVTFTLDYSRRRRHNGIITDVLPAGLSMWTVRASNTEFTFVAYDSGHPDADLDGGRLSESGAVSYKATVDQGATALAQPLHNVATIDSAETEPDAASSDVSSRSPAAQRPTAPPADDTSPRGREQPGQQPGAHPGGPRRPDPRPRLRHPGPGRRPAPEPPLGRRQPAARSPPGPAVGWSFRLPDSCVATPSGVRPGRSTTGGVPRSFGRAELSARRTPCRAGHQAPIEVSKPGSTSSTGPVESAPDAVDRRSAVVAHLEVGEQHPAGPGRGARSPTAGPSRCGGARPRPARARTRPRTAACRPGRTSDIEVLGPAAIARVDEPRAARVAVDAHTERRSSSSVWVTRAVSTRRSDRRVPGRQWLDVERLGAEPGLAVEGVEPLGRGPQGR